MKFVGPEWWPNFACYAKLAVLTFLVMNDPSVIHQIYTGQGQEVAKNLGQTVKEEFDSAMAKTHSKSSGDVAPMALIPAGPAGGSRSGPTVSANSATVPPPSFAWPAASTVPSSNPSLVAPQPVAAGPTANWSVPADPPSGRRTFRAGSATGSAAPSQQTSGGRFWQ